MRLNKPEGVFVVTIIVATAIVVVVVSVAGCFLKRSPLVRASDVGSPLFMKAAKKRRRFGWFPPQGIGQEAWIWFSQEFYHLRKGRVYNGA